MKRKRSEGKVEVGGGEVVGGGVNVDVSYMRVADLWNLYADYYANVYPRRVGEGDVHVKFVKRLLDELIKEVGGVGGEDKS